MARPAQATSTSSSKDFAARANASSTAMPIPKATHLNHQVPVNANQAAKATVIGRHVRVGHGQSASHNLVP